MQPKERRETGEQDLFRITYRVFRTFRIDGFF